MPFTLIQQATGNAVTGRSLTATFGGNITKGNLVVGLCGITPAVGGSNIATITVADNLSNPLTPTTHSMRTPGGGGYYTGIYYNLFHPGGADAVTFSMASGNYILPSVCWAYEFAPTGPVLYDTDAAADTNSAADPLAIINATQPGELIVDIIIVNTGTNPYNGAYPPWTLGPASIAQAASAYDLCASQRLDSSFTYNGQPNPQFGPGTVMMAAFADPQIYAWVSQHQGN